ncbi:MAG: hypothetical protein K8L91_09395 [Anaerolineae bacterium]|nr:hypothetical protein [Anaerolineae bacterium]
MTHITFETIVQAVHELTPAQKMALIFSLQREMTQEVELTREQALAELEALRAAGAFDQVESLRGKYANPNIEITDDELNAYLHEIGTAWDSDIKTI